MIVSFLQAIGFIAYTALILGLTAAVAYNSIYRDSNTIIWLLLSIIALLLAVLIPATFL